MDINQYIQNEVDRQGSTNYVGFREALSAAKVSRMGFDISNGSSIGHFVCHLAHKVNPSNAYHPGTNLRNLRTSHVGFRDGGTAAPTNEVPERFERWTNLAWNVADVGLNDPAYTSDVEIITKMLLESHPWQDGNGRTASIFRNWMLNTLDDPTPLPYYFGRN